MGNTTSRGQARYLPDQPDVDVGAMLIEDDVVGGNAAVFNGDAQTACSLSNPSNLPSSKIDRRWPVRVFCSVLLNSV